MATVTVLKFPKPTGAKEALGLLLDLQKSQLIKVHDAVIVYWPAGRKCPQSKQLVEGMDAMSGIFWGLLLGCVFAVPLFGMAIGAGLGALASAFRDYGIDEDFVNRLRAQVTQGTSALLLMTSDAVLDRVLEAMSHVKLEIIATNLSFEQEQKLREAFGQEELVEERLA
jgi:uncharacterized membrane protein